MKTEITLQIGIEITRCYNCGRHWGLETGFSGTCPNCAEDKLQKSREAQERLERSNRALRGAITRTK